MYPQHISRTKGFLNDDPDTWITSNTRLDTAISILGYFSASAGSLHAERLRLDCKSGPIDMAAQKETRTVRLRCGHLQHFGP